MKTSPIMTVIGIITIIPITAKADPVCTGNCKNYIYRGVYDAFVCDTTYCQCTSTTKYPCWNPCDENQKCDTTEWNTNPTYPGAEFNILYQCKLDTSTGICNIIERNAGFRCITGYYSAPTGSSPPCISCADATGNTYATSAINSTSITDCYVPANTEFAFSDTTGTGIAYFETDCTYTQ